MTLWYKEGEMGEENCKTPLIGVGEMPEIRLEI